MYARSSWRLLCLDLVRERHYAFVAHLVVTFITMADVDAAVTDAQVS
jgi:hypothetical protein